MLRNKTVFVLVMLAALCFSTYAAAEDLGQVNIPAQVKLKSSVLQPGLYTFAIEKQGDTLLIQLKQGGQVIASELAITKPAEKTHSTARLAYQPLKRDGREDPLMSRILCSYQGTLYLIYFEKP